MSCVSSYDKLELAKDVAGYLEKRERKRNGGNRNAARDRLASKIGVLPGTLYNLFRGRLKKLDVDLRDRLTAFAMRDAQTEMKGLCHELEMAVRMGVPPNSAMVEQIKADLSGVCRALNDLGIDLSPVANGAPAGSEP